MHQRRWRYGLFCHFGAARCRREIHSDFFRLPIEFQMEYLPLLDDWFERERTGEVTRLKRHSPVSGR